MLQILPLKTIKETTEPLSIYGCRRHILPRERYHRVMRVCEQQCGQWGRGLLCRWDRHGCQELQLHGEPGIGKKGPSDKQISPVVLPCSL